MKEIYIITNKYPNPIEKNVLVFVQQLVWTFADLNIKCSVICPVPININPKYMRFPYKMTETTENGAKVEVYFPKYIGFGQSNILGYNPAVITTYLFEKAVNKVIDGMAKNPDAVYGHFVTPAGIVASRVGRNYNIPSFMAYGESTPRTIEHFGEKKVANELSTIDGVIAVSTHSKEILQSVNAVSTDKIKVFPNGYRKERFYPRNKLESRKMFDLPADKFIVSFVGSFDHRKGVRRLMGAVNKLEDVYVIFAGQGKIQPEGEKCLYNESVNNEDLPYFYSASDVFVLPTLNEGCCNAIIEAMACGIPIISSDRSFNDDILDDTCSMRIDPLDVEEIKKAILTVYEDRKKMKNLSNGSLEKAKSLTLQKRAERILTYIEDTVADLT